MARFLLIAGRFDEAATRCPQPCVEALVLMGRAAEAIPILESRFQGTCRRQAQGYSAERTPSPGAARTPRELGPPNGDQSHKPAFSWRWETRIGLLKRWSEPFLWVRFGWAEPLRIRNLPPFAVIPA